MLQCAQICSMQPNGLNLYRTVFGIKYYSYFDIIYLNEIEKMSDQVGSHFILVRCSFRPILTREHNAAYSMIGSILFDVVE